MLIKCPECGGDVSDKAKNCPHCGYPTQQKCGEKTAHCDADAKCGDAEAIVPKESDTKISSHVTSVKRYRRRGLLRAPLTVLIPSAIMSFLGLLSAIAGTCGCLMWGRDMDGYWGVLFFIWGITLAFLGGNLSLIRGNSYPRIWFTIGLVVWLLVTMANPAAFVTVFVLSVAWCSSLYSTSARHWFVAHKRLAKRRGECVNADPMDTPEDTQVL